MVVDELKSSAPPPPPDTGPFPWSWPDAHFFTGRRDYWKAVEIVCRGALFIPVGEYRDNANDMAPAFVQWPVQDVRPGILIHGNTGEMVKVNRKEVAFGRGIGGEMFANWAYTYDRLPATFNVHEFGNERQAITGTLLSDWAEAFRRGWKRSGRVRKHWKVEG